LQGLENGLEVFQSDVDMVWFMSPFDFIKNDTDFEAQSQGWPTWCPAQWGTPGCLNAGLGIMKPTEFMIEHVRLVLQEMYYIGTDPQTLDNHYLLSAGIHWTPVVDPNYKETVWDGKSSRLNVRMWNPKNYIYFPEEWQAAKSDGRILVCLHVHVAGRGNKAQSNSDFLKQIGYWLVPAGTYESMGIS